MSKLTAYVTIYPDKVVTSGKSGRYCTYFVKEFKFSEKADNATPAISMRILDELYQLQDLGYEIIFRYARRGE